LRHPWLTPRGRALRRSRPYPTTKKDSAFVAVELKR